MSKIVSMIATTVAAAALLTAPPALAATPTIAIGVNVASDDNPVAMNDYVSAAGRSPAIVMWYTNWGGPLYYSVQMPWADQVGATPMITWDPATLAGGIPLQQIADGTYDAYLDASAALARKYGQPLLIRFAHEMNLAGSLYGPGQEGNTPAAFVAAWRHVVNRFATDGATNVRWVWSPNVDCGGTCPFDAFYPGDAYVDYTGLDGYNFSAVHHVAWQSFSQIFAASYDDITRLSPKPLIIAETASAEAGGAKDAWISSAFDTEIPTRFPRIVAVVWFDRVKETDWRIDSSAASRSAWQRVVAEPRYQGRLFPDTTTPTTTTTSTTVPTRMRWQRTGGPYTRSGMSGVQP